MPALHYVAELVCLAQTGCQHEGRLKGRVHGGAIQPHAEHMSNRYDCLYSTLDLLCSPNANPEYQNNLPIIKTSQNKSIAMATSSSISHEEIIDNASLASQSLQPSTSADLSYQLPDDFDFDLDKILADFDFTGLEDMDLTAPVLTFTSPELLAEAKPPSSASLQSYHSP
jgi:hypothetical protein